MTNRVQLTDLGRQLPARIDLFVCAASFEARCRSIASPIASVTSSAIIVRNRESLASSAAEAEKLQSLFGDKASEVILSLESPTQTADVLASSIIAKIKEVGSGNVFIDITTFTHEQLLILLGLIREHPTPATITLGYTSAGEYSTNTTDEDVWLSRGVTTIRSVLGYPGRLSPSKRLHLMILVGFESERAQLIIERLEPAQISLGIGDQAQSVSPEHFSRNARFHARLKEFVDRQMRTGTAVDTFTFSCIDADDARKAVLAHASKHADSNTVICPMNTKISTIGAGLAALEYPQLQIIYASPMEYNETGYSSPGNTVTLFELQELLREPHLPQAAAAHPSLTNLES